MYVEEEGLFIVGGGVAYVYTLTFINSLQPFL